MITTPTRALAQIRPPRVAYRQAFVALLARDYLVLVKSLRMFVLRTIMQPLLLVFVFTYVFPKIGQGVGGASGGESDFSTLLVAGVVGLGIVFQGIQAVALPLVTEFGYSKEIEDRVLAPLPVGLVAIEKIVAGMLQGLLSAAIVFPIAAFVPATPVHLHVNWLVLVTLAPLAGWVSASLGLMLGTKVQPMQVPLLFSFIVLPITFLGCVYFPWRSLESIRWLQIAVLVNPLVYMCEGFRAALTRGVPHMSLAVVYLALVGFSVLFTWVGLRGFARRVVG
jgi:ABC-2 type transport system permease protein